MSNNPIYQAAGTVSNNPIYAPADSGTVSPLYDGKGLEADSLAGDNVDNPLWVGMGSGGNP